MNIKTSIINISSESPPPYFNVSLCAPVGVFLDPWGLQDGRWGHIWLTGPHLALNLENDPPAEQTFLLVSKFKYSECSVCSVWAAAR